MTLDAETLFEHSREMLIQDECKFGYMVCEDHFAELTLLHQTVEDLIVREEEKEVSTLAEGAHRVPEDRRSEYWADNHPWWWEHVIAPQFRASFFMTLMAGVELHLGRFARDAGMIVRAPIGPDDLKGGVYPRTRRFLLLFCQFNRPGDSAWERIGDLYAVRNALVHAGGYTDGEGRKRVAALAARVPQFKVDGGRIELNREFCELAMEDCRSFLREMWQELVILCQRSK
jgi:hypothetical protein